ncbi:MAG: calcium-binding protein, partial [Nitrososphaeraceae archaeon]
MSSRPVTTTRTATITTSRSRLQKKEGTLRALVPSILVVAAILALAPISSAFAAALSGTNGDDTLRGTNNSDTIYGYNGNDKIYGYAGNDQLFGGRGDDLVKGDDGDDYVDGGQGGNTLYGGEGNDYIYTTAPLYPTSFPMNVIHGNTGNDYIETHGQNAIIYGEKGADNIIALGGDDEVVEKTVYAGSGNDGVHVNGNSVAYGGDGNDHLKGEGNASLRGEDGDDTLEVVGSVDHVYLTGGLGADHFDCGDSPD